jgi:signal transduction histidine kinase/ActR/RegA family two-component response regulator
VLALAFLGGLVLVLWWLQGARARKDLFAGTLGLVGSSAAYLVGMSGLFIGSLVPGRMVTGFTLLAIFALGLAIPEFVESYYLGRVTWLRRLNRVICGGSLLFGAVGLVLSIELMTRYYLVFVNWLFVLVAESIFISVRDALKRGSRFGPVVTVSVVLTALAGVNDLLADLGLTYAPRLFGMGLFNLAIASAVVVIGEFLGLAEENRVLSASLSTRNAELSKALAAATESARVKAEFLASTSHELRTPLNAIINIPQGLLEGIVESRRVQCTRCRSLFELEPGESAQLAAVCPECGAATEGAESAWALELEPRSTQRLLKSVVGSGQHLLAVVNDILDFSKLEASRMVLHRELVNVNELLENVRETLGPVAERAGVRLVVSALTVDVRLELDRVKLSQVLINLLSNAIKFSDGKGTVTLAAESSPGGLALSVRDEGIGIAPEHQGLIFEGFRQVEGGSTRRFGGTGLGLAISRKLVELHGARLELHSALGQGSTFTVQLPPEPGAVAEVSGGSRLVLVIDDEPTAVDAAAAALTPLGYTVRGVRDPRQALEEIRRQAPVMVILDVMMPRLSGIDVLKQLKEDAQLRAVPVLVASAYPDNREAVELLGARFLSKPWTPEELTRKMVDLAAPVRKSGGLTTS